MAARRRQQVTAVVLAGYAVVGGVTAFYASLPLSLPWAFAGLATVVAAVAVIDPARPWPTTPAAVLVSGVPLAIACAAGPVAYDLLVGQSAGVIAATALQFAPRRPPRARRH